MTDDPTKPKSCTYRHEPMDAAKRLNPRQELFAQHLASGMSQAAACRAAGYKGRQSYRRLNKFPNVVARLRQLQAQTAERTRITTDQLNEYLLALIERHKDSEQAAMLQMTRAAVMDLAKVNGLADGKGAAATRPCTCGGQGGVWTVRRILVYPDGREWNYGAGDPMPADIHSPSPPRD